MLRQSRKVPLFILQMRDILSRPEYTHLVEWKDDGLMFIIKDTDRFMREVAPDYFKQSVYKSFTRQMNMYDFHKCKLGHEEGQYFYHPYFQRDKPQLMHKIIRQSNSTHPNRTRKR